MMMMMMTSDIGNGKSGIGNAQALPIPREMLKKNTKELPEISRYYSFKSSRFF
jgi:hypothetical protein